MSKRLCWTPVCQQQSEESSSHPLTSHPSCSHGLSHSKPPHDHVIGLMQSTGKLISYEISGASSTSDISPPVSSPLSSSAPRSPKTDLRRPPPPKAGPCPPWCLQRPPRPRQARRRLLLAPRPDPREPRLQPGCSRRRSLRSPETRHTNPSSPASHRRKRVSV